MKFSCTFGFTPKALIFPFFCKFHCSQHDVCKSNLNQTPKKRVLKTKTDHPRWLIEFRASGVTSELGLIDRAYKHQTWESQGIAPLHTASSHADRKCSPLEAEYVMIMFILQVINISTYWIIRLSLKATLRFMSKDTWFEGVRVINVDLNWKK